MKKILIMTFIAVTAFAQITPELMERAREGDLKAQKQLAWEYRDQDDIKNALIW